MGNDQREDTGAKYHFPPYPVRFVYRYIESQQRNVMVGRRTYGQVKMGFNAQWVFAPSVEFVSLSEPHQLIIRKEVNDYIDILKITQRLSL